MENPNWNWGIILWLKKWTGWKHCKYQQQPVLQTAADTKTQISCLMDLWKRSETCLANPTLCCNSAHAPHAHHATCGGTSWKAKNRCQWPRWWKGQKLHHSQASQSLQRDEVAEGGQPKSVGLVWCKDLCWLHLGTGNIAVTVPWHHSPRQRCDWCHGQAAWARRDQWRETFHSYSHSWAKGRGQTSQTNLIPLRLDLFGAET